MHINLHLKYTCKCFQSLKIYIKGLIELFECYYCHDVFQRYDDFRDHLSSAHADLKKYVCPHKFCKANFNTVDELLEHARKGSAHEKVKNPEITTKK